LIISRIQEGNILLFSKLTSIQIEIIDFHFIVSRIIMEEIKSLSQFSNLIEKLNKLKDSVFLYRGCGKYSHKLLPSLYRHTEKKSVKEFLELETQILERFKQRSIPYIDKPLNSENNWSYLFLMQHYGVPTRLLDWTENPFIGLFFALTSAHYNKINNKFSSDAAFWILNATSWNMKAIDKAGYSGEILTHSSPLIKGHEPLLDFDQLNKNPIAIYGEYNSQRIVAQRGAFTIFGSNITPMERIKNKENFPTESLLKFKISKNNILKLLDSLLSVGITDSVIFPDLEGLSKEIKRLFKFEVGHV